MGAEVCEADSCANAEVARRTAPTAHGIDDLQVS